MAGGVNTSNNAASAPSSSLYSSSRGTVFSVTLASSIRKSTTFSSKIGARTLASALGFLR